MGKASRLKKVKEEKKENKNLYIRPRSADAFKNNYDAMVKMGWDKSGLLELIKAAPEIEVKVEKDVILQGVKNPLVTTFVGFSTAKLLDAMKRKKKTIKYVCIIEPNIGIFKNLIATEDISSLITDPSIDFILGVEGETLLPELFKAFTKPIAGMSISRTTMLQSMEIILDPFTHTNEKDIESGKWYVGLIQDTIQQIKLSMGCPDDQFRRFELMIENKDNMYNSWKINGLYDKMRDVPAIILGGGPSLEGFIKEYKENPKLHSSILIAVDAVLFKLLEHGIKPHIVTRCERKLTNIFAGVTKEKTEGIYYAAYPWTPSEFFKLFNDSFYLFRQNGVCLFTELTHAFCDGGVSSGNAAMELALAFGCEKIFLSGIDLCFIDGKTHVEGTQVEFNVENSKKKWAPVETNSGKQATTIPVWERCRNEYMQAIRKWETKRDYKPQVINTSTDGATIPCTTYKPWSEVLSMFDKDIDVSQIIKENRKKIDQTEIDRFEKKIKDTYIEVKKYKTLVDIALGLQTDAERTADREIDKLVEVAKASARSGRDLIGMLRANQANLEKLWGNVTDTIDLNFKQKLYPELTFRVLIFDVLQLQLFLYENATNSLLNTIDFVDQRHIMYSGLSREFMVQVKLYLEAFERLFI